MALLFSYGTLQLENVQIKTFGRILKGEKDFLSGFKIDKVEITNVEVLIKSKIKHHPIAIPTKNKLDVIPGLVFEITDRELEFTDSYEVSDYKRINVKLESGKSAWTYIENK